MTERQQNTYREGRMEGNARWPQTFSGINIFAVERCLLAPDPEEALARLLEPVPIDAELVAETETANKLHARFGVARVLKPEEVQENRVRANLSLLLRLGTLFGEPLPNDFHEKAEIPFGADGVWVAPETREYFDAVQKRFAKCSPQERAFITELFTVAADALRSGAGAGPLKERRELYAGWEKKSGLEQAETRIDTTTKSMHAFNSVRAAIHGYAAGRAMTDSERAFYDRFLAGFAV